MRRPFTAEEIARVLKHRMGEVEPPIDSIAELSRRSGVDKSNPGSSCRAQRNADDGRRERLARQQAAVREVAKPTTRG